jgi:protein TonB
VALLALAGSLAAHLVLAALLPVEPPVAVEGGGQGTVSVQGASFAQMAAGAAVPVTDEPPRIAAVAPARAAAVPPARARDRAAPSLAARAAPALAAAPAAAQAPSAPGAAASSAAAGGPARPAAPVAGRVALDGPPRISARPPARPASALRTAAAADPAPRRGTAQPDAGRGAAGGGAAAGAAGRAEVARARPGDAAASTYPGLVRQRIARQRMPRTGGQGVAQVAFAIAPGGGLAQLGLARSSGDARLDRTALELVRRAAPFPPPPAGAQRRFTIPIRAR